MLDRVPASAELCALGPAELSKQFQSPSSTRTRELHRSDKNSLTQRFRNRVLVACSYDYQSEQRCDGVPDGRAVVLARGFDALPAGARILLRGGTASEVADFEVPGAETLVPLEGV